jgi:cytochrome c peroxidase
MKKKLLIITVVACAAALSSFPGTQPGTTREKIKQYYYTQFKNLAGKLVLLKAGAEQGKKEKILQYNFLQARLAYKHIEGLLEYYQEGDAAKFNGLAIPFIEEEDPQAYQEPQGFQVIESFIYPHYDTTKKTILLQYIDKLLNITNGLANNTILFNPDEYVLDAVTEELYRIISLGITGFDSPIAKMSIPETDAAIESVQAVLQAYQEELASKNISGYNSTVKLLEDARLFARRHNSFDHFNRMEFITRFMNPVCSWLSNAKEKMGYKENPSRYTLIKKSGTLFDEKSLRLNTYLGDDTTTDARIALGKKLFYEPLLSINGNRSCAGCHHPGKAFTDGLTTAVQLDEHTALPRNTPTLWNAALQRNLFYDSRQAFLDRLITEVLSNEKEMNSSTEKAIEKIIHQHGYALLYNQAYPFADTVMAGKKIVSAIAMYLRTLVSYNCRFDKYIRGEKDKMTATEIKGFNLFMGKAKCGTCHYAPLFNGSKPPTYYYQESEVLGVPATTDTVHPILDSDPGRIHTLKFDFFNHAFKTPTLRNIALTAPYMHNGVYKTLEEVINFYDKGGGLGLGLTVPNQTLPADKLQLSKTEKKQLKAFLLTLTDTSGLRAQSGKEQ